MSAIDSGAKGGVSVLLLKTKSTPKDGYEEHFRTINGGHCFEPLFVPVLEHQFLDEGLSVMKKLLQSKQISSKAAAAYGGLIFTSQRAVEAFGRIVEEGKCDERWPHLHDVPIYTVGPATTRALQSIPQSPPLNIFGAETGNGEALARYMIDHYKQWYQDRQTNPPVLFLVGEQRRDVIPRTLMDPRLPNEQRIPVKELEIYGTGVMESFEQNFAQLLRETEDRSARWVVVFSPTGCEAMLRALGMLNPVTGKASKTQTDGTGKTYVATIGPTTRDYLKNEYGFEPDVCAAKPSPEGVEDGIRAFMTRSLK